MYVKQAFPRRLRGAALSALLALATALPAFAAEPTKTSGEGPGASADATKTKGEGPGSATEATPALADDPAFDRYVDLALLSKAWADLDAATLTDAGLQLAEGERVLLRPHKAITSDQVLAVAAKVAAEKRDAATLTRLAKAADALGKKGLAQQVSAAQKLASAARAIDPAETVSAERTSVEAFADFKNMLARVEAAKLANDGKALEAIAKEAAKKEGLSEDQRQYVAKTATEAREALPKDAEPDAAVAALKKLAAASRDDPTVGDFDSRYGTPGGTINAHITLNGDGTGSYTLDDGSSGDLYNVTSSGGSNHGPHGPVGQVVVRGNWSYGGDGGTFRWNIYANGNAFTGRWDGPNDRHGFWNGQR